MIIALSQFGISIIYTCYNLKLKRGKKCPDKNTNKCMKCKYCKAELSAVDATKLLNSYSKRIVELHNARAGVKSPIEVPPSEASENQKSENSRV